MNKNGYMVVWYKSADSLEHETFHVYQKELFEWLEKAKNENAKIAVYEVGDCLLDWSA